MPRVEIVETGKGYRVELDGNDISVAVDSLTLSIDARSPARVDLGVVGLSRVRYAGDAEVTVDDDTRYALMLLGWTPPQ